MSVRRSLVLLCGVVASAGLSGCALFEPWGDFWHAVKRDAKPSATDGRDTTEDSQHQWGFVGSEGRRGQDAEVDPDQWWRKYVMSEKARSIEENLGYE